MFSGFAIFPDRSPQLVALFDELEKAMDWACEHFGSSPFRIRYVMLATVAEDAVTALAS